MKEVGKELFIISFVIIKNILDEYNKSSSQINLDSDSARNELAAYIAKEISKSKEYVTPENDPISFWLQERVHNQV